MIALKSPRVRSIAAIAAAAAAAAWLTPFLFYIFTMPVAPLPPMIAWTGPLASIHAGLDVILMFPRILAIFFAVAILAGSLLTLLRLRHVAFYCVAGAIIAFGASLVAPLIVGDLGSIVLAQELAGLEEPSVMIAVLLAGMVDGAVFWFVARHFPDAPR